MYVLALYLSCVCVHVHFAPCRSTKVRVPPDCAWVTCGAFVLQYMYSRTSSAVLVCTVSWRAGHTYIYISWYVCTRVCEYRTYVRTYIVHWSTDRSSGTFHPRSNSPVTGSAATLPQNWPPSNIYGDTGACTDNPTFSIMHECYFTYILSARMSDYVYTQLHWCFYVT